MKQKIITFLIVCLSFTIHSFSQAPTISSFSPTIASVGSLVTINGTNLSNPTAVTIGGVAAIPISNTGAQLVAMVMPGASIGTVSIATASGTANAASNITITVSNIINTQQEGKLVGAGNVGKSNQGIAVAISADGNTAIIGGHADSSSKGAAWIFVRSGGSWIQQGNKLKGTGAVGNSVYQGKSVAISADGNTAIIGGYNDNSSQGAVWVFTRSGTTWSQQGSKLVGTGNTGAAQQGGSVAISADGNTAIVGGANDNNSKGAVWVFTRTGTTWSQQGSKLVGTGSVGNANQGNSVAVSADGNTIVSGGYLDNSNQGALWIFTRSGSTWGQQGNKLTGTGSVGTNVFQGYFVALSADGNTAITSAGGDNNGHGAVWVFTKSSNTWSQQGNKLVANDTTGASYLNAVALSADGNTAIIGGTYDNGEVGATWIFSRNGSSWSQVGNKIIATGNIGDPGQGYSVAISADASTIITGGYKDNNRIGAAWVYVPVVPIKIQTTISVTACNSYTWAANGNKVYTESNNTDSIVYTASNGNDSIVYLNLTINKSTSGTESIAACNNYLWQGITYNTSGTYTKTLTNSKGCDSLATLILTIKKSSQSTTAVYLCKNQFPYTWNGVTVYLNIYIGYATTTVHLTNAAGCDSSALLYAIVKDDPKPIVNYTPYNTWPIPNSGALICDIGSKIQLANLTSSLISGVWTSSNPNVVKVSVDNPYHPNIVTLKAIAVGTATISYDFSAQGSDLYCPTIVSTQVTVALTSPTIPVITGPSSTCCNSPTNFVSSDTGGYWYNNGGIMTSTGIFTATRSGSVQIGYTVYNAAGCPSFGSKIIQVKSLPATPTISYAPNTVSPQTTSVNGVISVCKQRLFTLVGTPTNGIWSSTGVISVVPSGIPSTTASVATGNVLSPVSVTYAVTDANGCSNSRTISANVVFCASKGINMTNDLLTNDFKLYPNPAHNIINVKVDKLSAGSIVVTDLYGKQLKTQTLSMGVNTIDVSSFVKGMYLVSIITEGNKQTQKIVVE